MQGVLVYDGFAFRALRINVKKMEHLQGLADCGCLGRIIALRATINNAFKSHLLSSAYAARTYRSVRFCDILHDASFTPAPCGARS